MTKLGKYLVLLNVVLSVGFLAWAVGLYTNHIHWNTPQSTDGQRVQGMVDELKDQITRLSAGVASADARWYAAADSVQKLEMQRPANRTYYARAIRSARRGDAGLNPPVQTLNRAGALSGQAYQIDGQAAQSAAGYQQAMQNLAAQIAAAQGQVKDLMAQTEQRTLQINGVAPPGGGPRVTAEQKGLRAVLAEQEQLAHDLKLEQQYLTSPITNLLVETQLLTRRRESLNARLEELRRSATALGRAD